MQTYTSKTTSVNTTKLPLVYNKINWEALKSVNPCVRVFDIGCGRETSHIEQFLLSMGISYYRYDPYWVGNTLKDVVKAIKEYKFVTGGIVVLICSNVLNVITPWKEVMKLKKWIEEVADIYFITIYEGNRTGIGKQSKEDCWQHNKPTINYVEKEVEFIVNRVICNNPSFVIKK